MTSLEALLWAESCGVLHSLATRCPPARCATLTCSLAVLWRGGCVEVQAARALPAAERDDGMRRTKQRLLGNIRLIAELFNKGQVNERIMLLILTDLLGGGRGTDAEPPEDSVEVRSSSSRGVAWGSACSVQWAGWRVGWVRR